MVHKIQAWFEKSELPIQAAFRVMDSDFDGFIGTRDMRKYLLSVLKIEEKQVT